MNVQEMETAQAARTPTSSCMVWEDGGYGLIAWKQDNRVRPAHRPGLRQPRLVKLSPRPSAGTAIGCEKSADLADVLEAAFAADGPSLVVIPIDYRENALLTERLGSIACPI